MTYKTILNYAAKVASVTSYLTGAGICTHELINNSQWGDTPLSVQLI